MGGTRVVGCWLALLLVISSGAAAAGELPLVEAVKASDRAAVLALLEQQIDVNEAEVDGMTALHWAVHRNDLETAELLIRAGARVEAANRYGVTPLLLACTSGSAALVDTLLEAGTDPNTVFSEGETALMTAARAGKTAAVGSLLAHGADVGARESRREQTALMWAAAEGHAATGRALIEGGADIDARSTGGFTALLFAVRQGNLPMVRTLLELGADPNEGFTGDLATPSTKGIFPRPRRIRPRPGSAAGAARAVPGPTSALVLAVMNAHFEIAGVLLDADVVGADPNAAAQGWSALHEITWVRRPNLAYNPPGPRTTGTLESLDLVRKLVAHGADVNARMTREPRNGYRNALKRIGATPFMLAAKTADLPLMRLLVALGADPLLDNDDSTTPLMVAAGVGVFGPPEDPGSASEVLDAVTLALELGGDVNAVDNNGETAMHGAAYRGLNTVVQFLVNHGADVEVWNQENSRGWTPLTIAEGIFRTATFKASPHTADLLRQLMSGAAVTDTVQPR